MKLYPLILGLLLVTSSCNDDDPTAPPITAENTFSCKINGDLFVPEEHGGFPVRQDGILVTQFENNWEFRLGNSSSDVYIYIVDVISTGSYELALSDGNAFFTQESENLMEADLTPGDSDISYISTPSSGSIQVLELEENQRIVLSFDTIVLVDKNNQNQSITLTEGKLNINLETLFEEE